MGNGVLLFQHFSFVSFDHLAFSSSVMSYIVLWARACSTVVHCKIFFFTCCQFDVSKFFCFQQIQIRIDDGHVRQQPNWHSQLSQQFCMSIVSHFQRERERGGKKGQGTRQVRKKKKRWKAHWKSNSLIPEKKKEFKQTFHAKPKKKTCSWLYSN